jgi:hypothetical protein
VASYDAPTSEGALFGLRFRVPNPPRHRWALMLHDLHHVATGYGTDSVGEAEISAWELRGGVRALGLYTGSIVLSAALLGLLLAPLRTLRLDDVPYEALLELSIGELRARLALPPDGLNRRPRRLYTFAPTQQR